MYPFILILISFGFFLLANTLVIKYKKKPFYVNYIIVFILIGLFFIINGHVALSPNMERAWFWSRTLFFSHLIFPIVLNSLFYLPDKPLKISSSYIKYIFFIPFITLALIDLFIPELTMNPPELTPFGWVYTNKSSTIIILYQAIYGINFLGVLLLLWYVYRTTVNKIKKQFCLFYLISLISPLFFFVFFTLTAKNLTLNFIPFLSFFGIYILGIIVFFIKNFSVFDVAYDLAIHDIIKNLSNVLILINPDNKIKEINDYALSFLNFSKQQVVDKNITTIIDQDEWNKYRNKKTPSFTFKSHLKAQNNNKIPCLISISKTYKSNLFLGYILNAYDLTKVTRLSDEKKIFKLKLQTLQSQMNPHFIFNTINSINYLISQNDELRTNEFITKLSQLIRKNITNSNYNFIPLEEEIENLKNYIQIEELRFENKFNYSIEIDKSNEILTRKIPPMLIQPFIENAIWHGLLNKKDTDPKNLTLSFKTKQNKTFITIEDDGIGRGKSAFITKFDSGISSNKSISKIQERIDLINQYDESLKIDFKITDKKNNNGTIIHLTLTEIN